jgi:hypothetical protein
MLKKTSNYILNTYLSKLDFVNKYYLKSVNGIQQIEQITITLSSKTNKNLTSFYKSSFFLVILTSIIPHIFAFDKIKSYLNKESDLFILTISLKSSKDINFFIYYFFNFIFKNVNSDLSFFRNKTYFLISNIPLSSFNEIDIFNKLLMESYDSISIKFLFSSKSKNYCFKTLPFFWLV